MTEQPSIALVGCGQIAHVHMHFLRKLGLGVEAVCDRSETRARDFCDRHGIATWETDVDVLLERHKPDCVHVLVPPHLHYEIAKRCLLAGCHVVIEKPLADTLDRSAELVALAASKELMLTVDHTRVYNPMLVEARGLIRRGTYGRIVCIEYDYDDPSITRDDTERAGEARYEKGAPPWFANLSGGVLHDLLPHPASVLLSLRPEMQVVASYGRAAGGTATEIVAVLADEGAHAVVKLSVNVRPLRNQVVIYCEHGTIRIDLRNHYSVYLPERQMPGIVTRVVDTFSSAFQAVTGFVGSMARIVAGRLHTYQGLDVILDLHYRELGRKPAEPVPLVNAVRTSEICDRILAAILPPEQAVEDGDLRAMAVLAPRLDAPADVLVTGGSGFIGGHVVEELERKGSRVRVLSRSPRSAAAAPGASVVLGDIRDKAALARAVSGVGTVVHCAAAMRGDWAEFYESTVQGTERLLDVIAAAGVRRLVYVSSLGIIAYSELRNGTVLDESAPVERLPERRGAYTRAKKMAEDRVIEFMNAHPEVDVTVLRPGLVYGRASNNNLANAGVLLGRWLLMFGIGGRRLGLNYVGNLANAIGRIAHGESPVSGIVHAVDSEQPTVRQYLNAHNALAANRVRAVPIPIVAWRMAFFVVDRLMRWKSGRDPCFSYRFNSNARTLDFSNERLRRAGALDGEIGFGEAIRETMAR